VDRGCYEQLSTTEYAFDKVRGKQNSKDEENSDGKGEEK
jgi:hypothetical protein